MHADNVIQLRKRLTDAFQMGLLEQSEGNELLQTVLIQILNEAEQEKTRHQAAAQKMREQAAAEEAQAKAMGAVSSIVFNVMNGFITKAQQVHEEEAERAEAEG